MAEDEFKKVEEQSVEHKNDEETVIDPEIEAVLESIPPKERRVIEQHMFSMVQMRSVASPEVAVMKKITEEHISKYLDGAELEMKNSYAEKFQKKVFTLLTMFIAMVFFIIIIILLKDKPDIMEKVLYAFGGVIAGAFGGYGLGKKQNDE